MTATAQAMLPLGERAGPAIPLRPYQDDALAAIRDAYMRRVRRQMIVLPTGTGKTVCFAHLIARRQAHLAGLGREPRALVLVHREELASQAVEKLGMIGGNALDIGVVKASRDEVGARVMVGSVPTLQNPRRLERLLSAGPVDTVVVDEAHHSVAESYVRVLEGLGALADDGPLVTGWTATAQRTDKLALGTIWQDITFRRGIVQMIAEGYLVNVSAQQIGSDFDAGNLSTSRGDFTDASIEAELERSDALPKAVRAWQRYAYDEAHPDGRLTVAFTPTIATAHALAAEFSKAGIPAEAVDGTTDKDERRAILRRIATGEIRVVCNCAVLTEGWDCPPVSCAMMLRPTKSPPFFCQMVGRVLRVFTGLICGVRYEKPDALVLDVSGASDLGLATLATLAGLPKKVPDGTTLLDAAEEAEETERQRVAVGAARTRQVNLLRRGELHWIDVDGCWVLAVGKNSRMILIPAGDGELEDRWQVWQDAPAGDGGARLASAAVLDLEWARGVGEEVARAAPTFARADAFWRGKPASPRQVEVLNGMRGVTLPDGPLTRGDAADLMEAKFAKSTIRRLRREGAAR